MGKVNSYTEWDPLEEVIVGRVDGARLPQPSVSKRAVVPEKMWSHFEEKGGHSGFDPELVRRAAAELDYLGEVLEGEGVTVRRPDIVDHAKPFSTPDFDSASGMYCAMPRDVLLIVGDEIIEAPMAWRSRFFEYRSYRTLIKEYFKSGAKWTAAPKPLMADKLYIDYDEWKERGANGFCSIVTEEEPVFDAAEFARFGKDIFVQQSHVTNQFGIAWMRRHLGDEYTIHELDFGDKNGMHIDGTFVPLAEGKLLLNPARPCLTGSHKTWYVGCPKKDGVSQLLNFTFFLDCRQNPHLTGTPTKVRRGRCRSQSASLGGIFSTRRSRLCLPPCRCTSQGMLFAVGISHIAMHVTLLHSPWTATANVLVIDEKRIIVEASEVEALKAFKSWGFDPIPVPFRSFLPFGGSFHCATCDVRRKGELRSVF